ncbi:lytic murein transglycosylase [Brevibacterium luteolum]|uniref:lytic transglycosylase domain-containing protein n=1 Tax=Brevibacterium luteolum TaxID=199591 RepID=UPI00223B21E9|nr:lytic murein transglycosylase [Brevibacterium luteolum]MCT1921403.1 lytic murein transglycosylase [Brevibacterium luteolum]
MKPARLRAVGLIAFGLSLAVLTMLFLSDLVGAHQRARAQSPHDPRPTAEAVPTPAQEAPAGPDAGGGADTAQLQRTQVSSQWIADQSRRTGIPARVLQSYVAAEIWAARQFPQCGLRWNTLAGIGFVESAHGTLGGTSVTAAGTAAQPIIGPQLNGRGLARITDTDGGRLDQDRDFDRAVGPMQFLPATWQAFGIDGNGDGTADAQNIDDATASAVKYLCNGQRNLATPEGWTQAILAYNPSDAYVRAVFDAANRTAHASSGAPLTPPQPAQAGTQPPATDGAQPPGFGPSHQPGAQPSTPHPGAG